MKYIEKQFAPPEPGALRRKAVPKWVPMTAIRRSMDRELPQLRRMMGAKSKDVTLRPVLMQDHIIDGRSKNIRVRRYFPAAPSAPRKGVLFFHGGGFFGGTITAVEEYCKALSDRADCVVISVEYHLAPEFPYPEGIEDCYCALKWAWAHADALGIDRARMAVNGDSAGGNFSAVIAQWALRDGEIALMAQVLIYPLVDFTRGISPIVGHGMDRPATIVTHWYTGDGVDLADPNLSPIRAASLAGLPPALIAVAERDALCAQGSEYAEALSDAGVDSTLILYKNTNHGFIDHTGVLDQGLDLAQEVAGFLESVTRHAKT